MEKRGSNGARLGREQHGTSEEGKKQEVIGGIGRGKGGGFSLVHVMTTAN